MNFDNAKGFGDVIAIACDKYFELKPRTKKSDDKAFHSFKDLINNIYLGHDSFLSIDISYQKIHSNDKKERFLLSLLRATNCLTIWDNLALKNSGVLNSVLKDKYLVLPTSSHRLSKRLESIRNLREINDDADVCEAFSNFRIVKCSKLLFKPVFSAYSYQGDGYFFDLESSQLKIRFEVFPFFHNDLEKFFSFSFQEKDNSFSIVGEKEPYKKRYLSTLDKLKSSLADFIIFPEMSLSSKALDDISSILPSLHLKSSALFVAGSVWQNNANTAYVFDSQGHCLLKQKKYSQFVYKTKGRSNKNGFIENIVCEDPPTIAILEVKEIGRVAIFICKDVLKRALFENVASSLRLDLIFVIAYSPSKEIENNLDDVSKNCHTTIVLVNACFDRKEGCKIYLPIKKLTSSDYEEKAFNACRKEECENLCSGREFTLDVKGK